ncbi:hypothetical protein [Halobacillus faecis]|uniref:DUF4367 domain-containing protein n=1 Tax=Halobacillus faecis TaxID=360184 RepID=A0A511WND9_9BACI|nr:hypothetical protein [Halobacillus faecis]GEN52656.1 hypothetical protein HFA01_09180 [Halobacillus faecis]
MSELTRGMQGYFKQSIKIKKILLIFLTLFVILSFALHFLKLPVNLVGWTTTFDVKHPEYIPFDADKQYGKKAGLDRVSLNYENSSSTLVVWVTNEIGWNNVSSWEEEMSLSDGTKAYYTESDGIQIMSWRINNVEYAIDYTGSESLSRNEFIKVASLMK